MARQLDFKNFNDRLYDGTHGENAFSEACKRGIIPNIGYGDGPQVTETTWGPLMQKQIDDNTYHGDKWIDFPNGERGYVDVKNSLWISEKSLLNFRLDNSYYFLNAFAYDSGCGYFLIRADKMWREWAMKNGTLHPLNKKRGFIVPSFFETPVSLFNNANGYFPDMDPKKYRWLVLEKYEENDTLGIPYRKRMS